ncbi:MAG TPA: acyltransferase [Nannocystis exedens]|nr:acyltransferase [Nannocystis exedens]
MWLALAEDAESGPTITAFRERARERQLILVAPIFEVEATTGRRFNTAVVIDERGEIIGKYRKTHIPEGRNEQNTFHESFYYGPSDGQLGAALGLATHAVQSPFFPVFETSVGRIGVLICYDRHFEGVVRSLALGGAELILAPAITFGATSQRMWRLEAQVDAMRHRVWIGASNRLGSEPPWNQEFFGDSFFCGPDGPILALSSSPQGLVIADLDLGLLVADSGSGWALNRDRRPEIYTR